MKKVIKSSLDIIPRDHIIEISVNYIANENYSDIAASKQVLDGRAREEFQTFVENVLSILDQYDFIIEEHHESNRNNSLSHYITFYPTDEDGNILDKYIIFMRLSDHNIAGLRDKSKGYHKNMAKKHRRSDRKRQKYTFEKIIIRNRGFPSYFAAIDHLYDMFDSMEAGSYYSK